MQILNVEPYKFGGHCLIDAIISLSRFFKCDYQLMFMSSMNFEFDRDNLNEHIGYRVNAAYSGDYIRLLEQYHGYKVQFQTNQTNEQILEIIHKHLTSATPPIIVMDSYYIPWDPKYMTTHFMGHVFIVVGIESETNSYIVTDPYYNKKAIHIPFEHLQKGYQGCYTINFVTDEKLDSSQMTSELIEVLEEMLHSKRSFNAICSFAEELKSFQFVKGEEGSVNLGYNPLFVALGDVLNARLNFLSIIHYLRERYSMRELDSFDCQFKLLSNLWSSIRALMAKGFIYKDPAIHELMLKNAVVKLINIAQAEDLLLQQLVNILLKNKNDKFIPVITEGKEIPTQNLPTENKLTDYIMFKTLFNNRGFASEKLQADFDLFGYYFSSEQKHLGKVISAANMKFQFTENDENGNDNISCFGQSIHLNERQYKSLMFLGTSELGISTDKIIFEYEDGSLETHDFGFSDWWSNTTSKDETIVWTTRVEQRDRGILQDEVKIYGKQFPISQDKILKRIELPIMPTIHIFAISGSY